MNVSSLLTDIQMVGLLKKGDERALTLIYQRHWQSLFRSSFNLLKDKAACEDIIQEIFIKIWDRRATLEIQVSLKAYLYAAMRYEVYRQIKIGNVREDIFDAIYERLHTPAAYGNLEHKELLQQINSIVDTLPDRCREVYKLSREEQLSHKEIAERLDISTKTVENQITKALNHLRTSLGSVLSLELVIYLLKK
ncbi:RNA polymerase sigma-70 factor (ECF subfamily) [Mucilaginibacter gracilis]|uniref:RNA polymerase sigma-70 factor (ECF subfamily) n=1 Tax=Mucilaginibacter gracilis TaxID=423350 RepID=A0A495J2Y5_9SPHI|nr:RNA polymerase sigma-70 factor [Mucilaginibacter gracilis]RKR83330.1 RNA polymerase sigma-70 factor (ECF subfamily) [Mucilaginibacter gracilis]